MPRLVCNLAGRFGPNRRASRRPLIGLAIILTLSVVACGATVRLERLESRVHVLEKFKLDTKLILERDANRLKNFSNRLNKVVKELKQQSAALSARVAGGTDDLRAFRGRIEELEYVSAQLQALTKAVQGFVDDRFGVSLAPLPKDLPKDAKGMFAYGKNLVTVHKFEEARTVLRHFVHEHGKDPAIPDAMILIGECYRSQRRFRKAMREYHEVWKQFSEEPQAATALWLTGQSLEKEGLCDKAKQMYKYMVRSYKKAPEAALAKKALAEMKCK